MTPNRTCLPLILRRTRKNLRPSVPSDEAAEDHLSDVAEGAIEVRPEEEEEEEDCTVTRVVDDSKGNETVAGWRTITHCYATSYSN